MKPLFATLAVVAITVGSGFVHGRFSGRWGHDDILQSAGQKLLELPPGDIGPWELVSQDSLSESIVAMLECTGNTSRAYVNRETGDRVTMFVIVGPHGPTVVHTPDICYSSRDYDVAVEKDRKSLRLKDGSQHAFWVMTMNSRNELDPHQLRVWYGWSDGKQWTAKDYPRFSYLGTPRLYKIQVAARLAEDGDASRDPVENFLQHFLPVLAEQME